jgi:hypothetical protein
MHERSSMIRYFIDHGVSLLLGQLRESVVLRTIYQAEPRAPVIVKCSGPSLHICQSSSQGIPRKLQDELYIPIIVKGHDPNTVILHYSSSN